MKTKSSHRILFFLFSLLCISRAYAQIPSYVPTSGLVAYYPFNGNMTDATGNGNNGVLHGTVTYGTDRFGTAASCFQGNGAGEGDIPVNTFPTGNTARSISVYFKYKFPYAGGGRAFFGWGNNSFAGRFNLFGSGTYVGVEYVNGVVQVNGYTPDTCWHNLTATYPSTGGGSSAVKLYFDGVLVTTTITLPTSSYSTPNGPWHGIGGNVYYLPGYTDSWTGKLDDIGVWNRELTAAEVSQIWASGLPAGSGVVTISGAGTICSGASISLSGSPSGGTWSSGGSAVATVSATGVVTGLTVGTAVITYSTLNGCMGTFNTALVTVISAPNAGIITGPATVCQGATITFTDPASGGTWTSSLPGVATINAFGGVGGVTTGTTIISYSVTNSCGTTRATQAVTVLSLPNAGTISGATNVCPGGTIVLTDASGGGSWTSSATTVATVGATGVVSGITTGTTIVSYSVTNACGTTTDTQAVAVIPLPNAGIITGPTNICPGTSIILSDLSSGGVWSSSATSVATVSSSPGIVGGAAPGTAIISYTVTNMCGTATDTQAVVVMPLPNAGIITGPTNICPGTSIILSDLSSGGVWSSNATSVATVGALSGVVGGAVIGTATISYTVTNTCGSATDTQAVTVAFTTTTAPITGPTTVCTGATIVLADGTTGGTWSSSTTGIATVGAATGIVGGVAGGSATITYIVTNVCGTASAIQTITVNPAPNAGTITGPTNVCIGGSITLSDLVTGGIWSSGSSLITIGGSTGVVTGLTAGTTIVTYTITNSCGTATDTQAVMVNPLPDAGVISTTSATICAGTGTTLSNTISGGAWTSSNIAAATISSSSGQLTGLTAGAITVTYTTAPDAHGCVNNVTYPVTIISPASFVVTGTVSNVKCNGDANGSITIAPPSGIGPYQYTWSDGSTGASVSGIAAGSYTVVVTDLTTNCVDTRIFDLDNPPVMNITSVVKNEFCSLKNGSIDIRVTGGFPIYFYAWSNSAVTEDISGLQEGIYNVVVTDQRLCSKQLEIAILEDSCDIIVIHDAITPNGDGINDVWVIEALSKYPKNTVQLFDKWGDLVFSATGYSNNWGGEGKNGLVPDGTYFYLIKLNAENIMDGKNTFTGSLLIKR